MATKPAAIARAVESTMNSGVSGGARADTIENDMTACTEETTTTSWRDVPKMA